MSGGTVDYDYVRWVNGIFSNVDPVNYPLVLPPPAGTAIIVQ